MNNRGFTLVELIIAIGLFAFIMTIAAGSYLVMIGVNRQVQATATGVDNLSFALEEMTRTIRTSHNYTANLDGSFTVLAPSGSLVTYSVDQNAHAIEETVAGSQPITLTDPSVTVTGLDFYPTGLPNARSGDYIQANVVIVARGTVGAGSNRPPVDFTIETSATMRGTDL